MVQRQGGSVATPDEKDIYRTEIETVRQKRDSLPATSHVRAALTDDVLNEIAADIEASKAKELQYADRPPIFGYIETLDLARLAELDCDIDLILKQGGTQLCGPVTQFLRTKATDHIGIWSGGMFDVWTKATLLKRVNGVLLDHPLPNGRNSDICIQLENRHVHIESTAISQDDEMRNVWERYINAKKGGYDKPLIRPGPFCPPNSKGPSPYYLTLRLYAKVFDKLASGLDPEKSQFADSAPNLLLVSFAGPGMRTSHPGARWAWEELLGVHPNARGEFPEGSHDVSLEGWLEFAANERINAGKITVQWYCDNFERIITAPQRLSGILMFDGCTLAGARVNYNVRRECQISHAEIAQIEKWLTAPAPYWW